MVTAIGFWAGILLAEASGSADSGGGGPASLMSQLFPILAIFILFWFIVIRPAKNQDRGKGLENLQKNDRVVTIGGIFGTVLNAPKGSEEVVLRVDDNTNTRLHVLRSAIARVVNASGEGEKKEGE